MNDEHKLDRHADETQEAYDGRIDQAARDAGMTRDEYERTANEEAGRPPITPPSTNQS